MLRVALAIGVACFLLVNAPHQATSRVQITRLWFLGAADGVTESKVSVSNDSHQF